VLCRGDDFFIIDFEGEPSRPLAERRAKGSPVRDVMGMARSFDYAPEAALRDRARRTGAPGGGGAADPTVSLVGWAKLWKREVTGAFSSSYLATVRDAPFVPQSSDELTRLFTFYELERVIYEIGYELDNRPDWAEIPLRGLAALIWGEGEAKT
jgi:maltose alpha-D-glucosyltransferase/alpha-amylase